MTKADIVEKIKEKMGLTARESSDLLEEVLKTMKETLESGESLKINGFGSFTVRQKNARKGRNPQTAETMTLPARRVVTFKPSNLLRQAMNSISK